MSRDKQIEKMYADIVEIFDEEYGKRNLITPQNTAEKMTAKGYRKSDEVAREIFDAVDEMMTCVAEMTGCAITYYGKYAELKKKYTEEGK